MKYLLDTHIFLWFISGDKRLPIHMKRGICEANNEVYLSVVSIWESIIKQKLGKLILPKPASVYLPKQREKHSISSLPLTEPSVAKLDELPHIHKDPFDRILICQSIQFNLTIMKVYKMIK